MQITTLEPRAQRRPRVLRPATGKVRVLRPVGTVNDRAGEIAIEGKAYYLALTGTGYRLHGYDARAQAPTLYDLPLSLDSCDCPDATYNAERPGGCKHRRALAALKAAGKLGAAATL